MSVGVGRFEGPQNANRLLSLLAHSIALFHLANVTLCAGAQRTRQLHTPLCVSAFDLQRDGRSRMQVEYETDEAYLLLIPTFHPDRDLRLIESGSEKDTLIA